MKAWLSEVWYEWKARRAGRRHLSNDLGDMARDVTGPTGYALSRTWDQIDAKGSDAYKKSFDKGRLPPSTFVSSRDAVRHNNAMPLAERCIEDLNDPDALVVGDWSTSELDD